MPVSCVRDQGSGIRDQGSGIRDQGSGIRDQGSGIRDQKKLPAALPPRECWGAWFCFSLVFRALITGCFCWGCAPRCLGF
ncbi:MAG: hypothetical protein LBI62_08475 [Candidatus Accumulibacter sp.]|nr:hypothetical protein [Accumulibacter sp.]